jgi:hypothetical protein
MLQALAQLLLPLWRKIAKLGIALECSLLLLRREVFVPPQPVSSMMLLLLLGTALTLLAAILRHTGRGA